MVEPSARFEEIRIPLPDPVHGLREVSAVLGIPRWWPTGSRVSVVLAHGSPGSHSDPLIEYLHRDLTERRYLCLRFNFPFAEAKKRRPDPPQTLRRTFRAAVDALSRDPTAAPAHLFLAGKGLGAQTAADLSVSRVRADGLILMGYPLHPQGKPERLRADQLYRVVAPMLFVQGTRDRNCEIDALQTHPGAHRCPDRPPPHRGGRPPLQGAEEVRAQRGGDPPGGRRRDRRLDREDPGVLARLSHRAS